MKNTAKRRKELLGISFGAACNKLRKNIMFSLVQKLNENICFRCKEIINTPDEFSIEHKIPWENKDKNLFWDLNNIAFSHIKCNRPTDNGSKKLRKIGPEGTSWCGKCKLFLPIENFMKSKKHWNGLQRYCILCFKEWKKQYPKLKKLYKLESQQK